ncbi:MAG TPA: hypothetical protein VLJ58_15405 [Ramlibacter sp.]|nr:hypothetical protein [Ramlibacter sp.]
MKKTLLALSSALLLGLSSPVFAAAHAGAPMAGASGPASTMPKADAKADAKAMKKQADADYKAAKAKCKPMKGDEQKACMKDAKTAHTKAEADIKAAKK